jgi:hypothetical protein
MEFFDPKDYFDIVYAEDGTVQLLPKSEEVMPSDMAAASSRSETP